MRVNALLGPVSVSEHAAEPLELFEEAVITPTAARKRVDDIASMDDILARNQEITARYGEYAQALKPLLGSRYANFASFLVLGSQTAGRGMERLLFRLTGGDRALGDGNRALFLMTAPTFERFMATFGSLASVPVHQRRRDEARWRVFENSVRSAAPTPDIDVFVKAFRQYYEAMFEPDYELRQQRIYFGNVLFAYVEQRAAQPILERSMPAVLRPLVAPLIGKTELPGKTLWLREDVPGPYAPALEQLRLPQLKQWLSSYDRTPGSTQGSAVWNWFDFDRRMGWLVEMFRTQADNPDVGP